ncbi:MAG TPA: hypothetical protein VII39_07955 [Bradyrhizobium sp.]
MQAYRIGLSIGGSIVLAICGGVAVSTAAFSQENRGTQEQQMACTPDVFRLCGAMIPDAGRITECLRQNTPLLSGPCRAVFEPAVSASEPQRLVPRARGNSQRASRGRPRYDEDDDDDR